MANRLPRPAVLQRFGRLRVFMPEGRYKSKRAALCICDCQKLVAVDLGRLYRGAVKSCGCLKREANAARGRTLTTTHGMTNTPTYTSWTEMRRRVGGGHLQDARYYNGVTVHPSWDPKQGGSFEQFLADIGERPTGTSLDRYPNPAGSYEPGNVRWATPRQQAHNRRNTITLTYNGETLNIAEWSRRTGIGDTTIRYRVGCGWSPEQIFELKPDTRNRVCH